MMKFEADPLSRLLGWDQLREGSDVHAEHALPCGRRGEHWFGFDLHYLGVYQDDFGENLSCGFLEPQRRSTKPWNVLW